MLPAMLPCGLKLAVLMPTNWPWKIHQCAACRLTRVDRCVGLDEVLVTQAEDATDLPLETMPEVTVWVKPNGLPIATTKSPTRNLLLSASLISGQFICFDPDQGDVGVCTSEPRNSALKLRPSANVTCTASAFSIT